MTPPPSTIEETIDSTPFSFLLISSSNHLWRRKRRNYLRNRIKRIYLKKRNKLSCLHGFPLLQETMTLTIGTRRKERREDIDDLYFFFIRGSVWLHAPLGEVAHETYASLMTLRFPDAFQHCFWIFGGLFLQL